MAVASRSRQQAARLQSGPWRSVFTTSDPYDASPDILVDARNTYIPDPEGGSGVYARPGFRLLNASTPLFAPGAGRCQGIYAHPMLDGSTVNLVVMAGRLYRANEMYDTYTDITPAGITIDASVTTRVTFASLIGTLIVSDGVHRPWVCTDPSIATPVATSIDYDGAGGSWTAYGAPVVYGGAVFFILNQVNGVSRRADISWSNPGTPLVGWQQTDYDNNWTLSTNESGDLYVLVATNQALYYFRERSIGYATGTVGPDLASTATEDAVGFNVGALASQLVVKFGNAIFFGDAQGRPNVFTPGTPPKAIWKQLRGVVDDATTGFPGTTRVVSSAALESNLNLACFAIWSPSPATLAPPTQLVVFDAVTATYQGLWRIGAVGSPVSIEHVGTFLDASGRATMIVAGSKDAAPADGGYLWAFSGFSASPDTLVTEGSLHTLVTEGSLDTIVTEGTPANWLDNGAVPDIFIQTDRLGYSDEIVYNVDTATISTLSAAPCVVTVQTTTVAAGVEGTPSPSPSFDGTYRLTVGCDAQGRGPAVNVGPTTATEQWVVERVTLRAIPSLAGPEEA